MTSRQIDDDEDLAPEADYDNPFAHDPSVVPTTTPLWREIGWGMDWMRLRMSPVFYGAGLARGNREPVLLIPGFMAGDVLMLELHRWLKRLGYRSYLSNITWNNDCPDRTARSLAQRAQRIRQETGMPLRLIGHSLGGMLAKSLVQDHPDLIDRVITLGSPFRSMVKAHPAVVGIWDQLKRAQGGLIGRNLHASCGTGHCLCAFVRNMLDPKPRTQVPQFAVYSRTDGVAEWSSCIEEEAHNNTEVHCTHIGMVFHPEVYRAIARRLAQPLAGSRQSTEGTQERSREHRHD